MTEVTVRVSAIVWPARDMVPATASVTVFVTLDIVYMAVHVLVALAIVLMIGVSFTILAALLDLWLPRGLADLLL